jgi:hypothetical protein
MLIVISAFLAAAAATEPTPVTVQSLVMRGDKSVSGNVVQTNLQRGQLTETTASIDPVTGKLELHCKDADDANVEHVLAKDRSEEN